MGDSDTIQMKVEGSPMDYGIIISIAGVIISAAIAWGVSQQKIHALEERVTDLEKDHDILVEIRTKIDLLLDNRIATAGKKNKR